MKEKLIYCLAILALILIPSSGRAEDLLTADGPVARVTIDGVTTSYSTLPEAWVAAKGKTATITMLQSVNLGTTKLEIDDANTDITLTRCPESEHYSRIDIKGQNSESLFDISNGTLTIVWETYLDFFIYHIATNGGVCVYVHGSGKFIADGVNITSSSSYGIFQMSSQPVVIKGNSFIKGGTRMGIQYASVFSNSSNSKFSIESGNFATGLENNAGNLKGWLAEGKAFYTFSSPSIQEIYTGVDSKNLHSLYVFDCLHTYESANWTYENYAASCNCVVCGHANIINNPAVYVESQDGVSSSDFYSAELDDKLQQMIDNKSATITLLRDATIPSNLNRFAPNSILTFCGNNYTLTGTLAAKKLIIKNGTFNSGNKDDAIYMYYDEELYIHNGKFYGKQSAINTDGKTTIENGEFYGESGDAVSIGNYPGNSVQINGGKFKSNTSGCYGIKSQKDITLNGGEFPVTISSTGGHSGGICISNNHLLTLSLGDGKAFYVDKECTKYLLYNEIKSQLPFSKYSFYVDNCLKHVYYGSTKPTADVACSYCGATMKAEDIVAECSTSMTEKNTAQTDLGSANFYVTDIDACLGYYVPESYVSTLSNVTLLKDAQSSESHSLANGVRHNLSAEGFKLTNSTLGKNYFLQVENGSFLGIDGGTYESTGNHDMIHVCNGGSLHIAKGKFLTYQSCYSVKGEETASVKLLNGEFQHGLYSTTEKLNTWLQDDSYFYWVYAGNGPSTALLAKTRATDTNDIGNYVVITSCPGHEWGEWVLISNVKDGTKYTVKKKRTCSVCELEETSETEMETCDHKTNVNWTGNTTGMCPTCGAEVSITIDAAKNIEISPEEAHVYKNVTFCRAFTKTDMFFSLCVPFDSKYGNWKDNYTFYDIYSFIMVDEDNDGILEKEMLMLNEIKNDDDVIKGNTPYFVKAKNTGTLTNSFSTVPVYSTTEEILPIWCASTKLKYEFYCVYTSVGQLNDGKTYNIAGGGFNLIKSQGTSIAPTRWYMKEVDHDNTTANIVNEPSEIKLMVIGEDDATAINEVTTNSPLGELEGASIYNLNGQRLSAPVRGRINIINGKKVFVR